MIEVPLFPLHAVLCPGVSMPLHVFEPRYRALVRHCLAENAPFGVVLIREGREVGGGSLAVAEVGTFAEIREASRFADGRFDLVAHGAGRFRLNRVIVGRDPFLVGVVDPVVDELGDADVARELALSVTRQFIRYLELLQPGEGEAGESEIVLGLESEEDPGEEADEPTAEDLAAIEAEEAATGAPSGGENAEERVEISSADLTIPDEPTTLSYLLTGIVELDLPRRQALLEASTTELRLGALAAVLEREIDLLGRRLRMYAPDPRASGARRN
ncbi:MAG TPA: LON peptidase substrate-binding domain-containing protein [Candidatus Limnocylindrales bacterium]|nr:LON peptidase substrate-binding domain-containing protein [Candidatus Limnocylindrales bacterium]